MLQMLDVCHQMHTGARAGYLAWSRNTISHCLFNKFNLEIHFVERDLTVTNKQCVEQFVFLMGKAVVSRLQRLMHARLVLWVFSTHNAQKTGVW